MNSIILSWIYSCFVSFKNTLYKSKVFELFNMLYSKISSSVLKSAFANYFKSDKKYKALVFKILNLPFWILQAISKILYKPLVSFTKKSIIAHIGKIYFNCFSALNSRFFGSIILSFSVLGLPKRVYIIIAVLGILLLIKNINFSDFLNESMFVRLLKNAAGFSELTFNLYNPEFVKLPLVFGILTGLIMGIISYKALLLGLLLPFLLFGMFLVLIYPIAGIFAAVFLAPLIPTMLLAGLCMFTLLSLYLNKTLIPNYKRKKTGLGYALMLLLVLLGVSSIFSFNPLKSIMVWSMYLVFFSFYFVLINTVKTKEQLLSILKLFVISGAFVALYGVLQYIFKWNTQNAWIDEAMFEEATMRAYSTLENPNVLGEYLLLLLPVSAVFMLKMKKNELSKWVYAGIFLISAICLIFTQSRGCWLGFILSLAVFISFYKGKLWIIAPFGILLLPFILPQTIIDRILSIGNMSDSSTSYRVYIWYGTIEMLKTFFVGGIGMGEGAFRIVYPFYGYDTIIAPHSHNLFLQLLVEGGIGALIIFLSACVIFFKYCVKTCKKSLKNSYEYLLGLALASGVLGFLLQSMFDYTFYNYRVMAIFIMYLAFGASLIILGKDSLNDEKDN